MPEANLDKTYVYDGEVYGPGPTEIPEDIDKDQLTEEFRKAIEGEEEKAEEAGPRDVADLLSVDPAMAAELKANGFGTVEALSEAKDKDILNAVNSVDKAQLKAIREELKDGS